MPTPRPHYKERIAYAEGYEIEFLDDCGVWKTCVVEPAWRDHMQYRVKKPDVVRAWTVDDGGIVHIDSTNPNLRLTFDGETGKLKSAEVIGE